MEYRVDEKILGAVVQHLSQRRYSFAEWPEARQAEAIIAALNECSRLDPPPDEDDSEAVEESEEVEAA